MDGVGLPLLKAGALLACGHAMGTALWLGLTHVRVQHYPGQRSVRWAAWCLLGVLASLQAMHFAWLYGPLAWVHGPLYRMALFAVAPLFWHVGLAVLKEARPLGPMSVLHAVPLVLAAGLPSSVAVPLAFVLGVAYVAAIAPALLKWRHQREHFQREMGLLAGVLVAGSVATVLGVMRWALGDDVFFSLYAVAIGLALWLLQLALTWRPTLAEDVQEAMQMAEATPESSTLKRIDCDHALQRLQHLMDEQKVYLDPELSLPTLADQLQLSTHQLSELLNHHVGKGFLRYLREHRVAAAKSMLLDEPSASVLSVGLNVGFASQSSFYDAFREVEGMTPGQYRKRFSTPPA
ncbi:hypothetical protein GCM10028785_21010 [Hydrogenophaga soli]